MHGSQESDDVVSISTPSGDEFADEVVEARQKLEQDLRATQASAYAAGTLRILACQWQAFRCFALKFRMFAWPVPEHTLCLFAQYLAYTFHSAAAVRNYLSRIVKIHVLLRATPSLMDIEVKLTLQGLNKTMLSPMKQAQPMMPEILLDLVLYLDLSKRRDLAL